MHGSLEKDARAVISFMRYRDVAAAVDWLCRVFGFERHRVIDGANGEVLYAELSFGAGMIMLGSDQDHSFRDLMAQPDQIGGVETQTCYLVVGDADAYYNRAKAEGAGIALDIRDDDDGARFFTCRDLESHIWTFGTYAPGRPETIPAEVFQSTTAPVDGKTKSTALVWGVGAISIASVALAGWVIYNAQEPRHAAIPIMSFGASSQLELRAQGGQFVQSSKATEAAEIATTEAQAPLLHERNTREAAAQTTLQTRERLTREQDIRQAAERATADALAQIVQEGKAREAAELAAKEAQVRLDHERSARQAADRTTLEAREQLAREQGMRQAADRATADALAQFVQEGRARKAAELAAKETQVRLDHERSARQAADRAALEAREELAREQGQREAAVQATLDTQASLVQERKAKETAEADAKSANAKLALALSKKDLEKCLQKGAPPSPVTESRLNPAATEGERTSLEFRLRPRVP